MATYTIMEAGEKLWNGTTVTPYLAAAYNSISARIEGFERDGIPVPEYLLNGRHNLIAGTIGREG